MISAWILIILLIIHNVAQSISCRDTVDKELCNIIKEKKHCENEKLKAELKRVCEKTCNLCDYIPPKPVLWSNFIRRAMATAWTFIVLLVVCSISESITCRDILEKKDCEIIKKHKYCEDETLKPDLKKICEETCNLCNYKPPKLLNFSPKLLYGLYEYGGRANTSHVLMNMKHRFTTIKLLKSGLDNNNKSARRGLGPSKRQQVVVDYYSSSSTMNGLRHLSQEERNIVLEERENFRNQVSNRMGEMLLRGDTMLDEYCSACGNVLMANREGTRSCVACEFRTILSDNRNGSQRSVNAAHSLSMADINVQDSNLYQINDTNESVQQTLNSDDRLSNEVNQTEHRNGNSVTPSASVIFLFYPLVKSSTKAIMQKAIEEVERKLEWCTERLHVTESVEEIALLNEAILAGLRILQRKETMLG
ncbi:unnamed protein product [Dracunculus medinensis]|uniref:ShKT domain-containing protein n=1 Tax=Dracunculus medinensis TaxID=318479 RepID=A0A158Q4S5_DRAME|nr:unnamed protein product [Dracunculus medinensis]